jgi:hypothetical protein
MSALSVRGTIAEHGKPPALPVPLRVAVTLSRDDTDVTDTYSLNVVGSTDGTFAAEFSISADVEAQFTVSGKPGSGQGTAGGRIAVRIDTYPEGLGHLEYSSPVVAFFGRDQTFESVASSLVDDLHLDVTLSGLTHYFFQAVLSDADTATQSAFKQVDELTCELLHQDGREPAMLVRAAPGKDGAPADPDVEAAVDAFDDAILSGPKAGQSAESWEQELDDLKDDINQAADPSAGLPSGAFTLFASAPAIRSDSYYRAIFLLHADQIDDPDFFVRFRSAGPHLQDELVLRSIPLPLPWTSSGLISRIVQKSGIGSISTSLKDRTYQAPFVLVDPDLDLVKGKLRVRGRVGVGTGANMVLAQIASIDVTLSLALHDYTGVPFSMTELARFFDLKVVKTVVDILPGTDIDELPAWVWAAIAVLGFPIGLTGIAETEALIAAIELALRPVVSSLVQAEAVAGLAKQLHDRVDDELDDQIDSALATSPIVYTAEQKAALRDTAWFTAESLTIDDDDVTVTGFAGLWDPVTSAVNLDVSQRRSGGHRRIGARQG